MCARLMLTTGIDFQGYRIRKYHGIVTGETALGTGFLSSYSAAFADFFGTNSSKYSAKLMQAKDASIRKMEEAAIELGANAIIGVSINYTAFSADIMGVAATGTAVKVDGLDQKVTSVNMEKVEKIAARYPITACNMEMPIRPIRFVIGDGGMELEAYIESGCDLNGMVADVVFKNRFEEEYTSPGLHFLQIISMNANRFSLRIPAPIIPEYISGTLEKCSLIIKRYIDGDRVVILGAEQLKLHEISDSERLASELNGNSLLSEMNDLKNAREILGRINEISREFPGRFDTEMIEKLEAQARIELMYGNQHEQAMKIIREYLDK